MLRCYNVAIKVWSVDFFFFSFARLNDIDDEYEEHLPFVGFMPWFVCGMQADRPTDFPHRESPYTRVDAPTRFDRPFPLGNQTSLSYCPELREAKG